MLMHISSHDVNVIIASQITQNSWDNLLMKRSITEQYISSIVSAKNVHACTASSCLLCLSWFNQLCLSFTDPVLTKEMLSVQRVGKDADCYLLHSSWSQG